MVRICFEGTRSQGTAMSEPPAHTAKPGVFPARLARAEPDFWSMTEGVTQPGNR